MGTLDNLESRDVHHTFVETGFGSGDTLRRMLKYSFERFVTIELDAGVFHEAVRKVGQHPKVDVYRGDSASVLPSVINPDVSTTFWLDAHFSGGLYGEQAYQGAEAPLLAELEAILSRDWQAPFTIFIDDVRILEDTWWDNQALYEPARDSLSREAWPTAREVLKRLQGYRIDLSREDIWTVRHGDKAE